MMDGIRPRAAERYMDDRGQHCPHCEAVDGIRRVPSEGRLSRHPDTPPRFAVPCYCAHCSGEWTEGYVMVSVEVKPLEVPA